MNSFDAETLLRAFPMEVDEKSRMAMMAAVVAEELERLFDDNDLLSIYTQIDALDGSMLDILADDFKVDWWDANAPLDKKRETFKNSINVHRALGTTGAVKKAITSMYAGATVLEWYNYGGDPYHYKLSVNLGDLLGSAEILQNVVARSKYYANVRSVLDGVSFRTDRVRNVFYGFAATHSSRTTYPVAAPDE